MKQKMGLLFLLLFFTSLFTGCQQTSVEQKPSVHLTLKVPTLAMTCTTNPEIREAYQVLT